MITTQRTKWGKTRMLYGKRTSTVVINDVRIVLKWNDGEVTWKYEDVDTYGNSEYTAEEATVYDNRQGTYVNGYELLIEPVDIPRGSENPRVFATVIDNNIDWVGGVSASPLDELNLNQRGERL